MEFKGYFRQRNSSEGLRILYSSLKPSPWDPWLPMRESVDSFLAVMPTALGFILARLLCGHLPFLSARRFLQEFALVAFPSVIFTTAGSDYSHLYSAIIALIIVDYLKRKWSRSALQNHIFEMGQRPMVFSLARATAYSGTCVAILAVDFPSFPLKRSKSMTEGAALMDMGIGLFVINMGFVSRRARTWSDLRRLPRSVVPLLILGLMRTSYMWLTENNGDKYDYGRHLNAYSFLGLTKLMGSLYGLLARSDGQLVGLSLALLILHELLLQLGLNNYVLTDEEPDTGFFSANREGFTGLQGSVSLYLLGVSFAKWYTSKDHSSYHQMTMKLKRLLALSVCSWLLVLITSYLWDICHITFSSSYVLWIFAISVSLVLIYTFVFEFALANMDSGRRYRSLELGKVGGTNRDPLPSYVESLSRNGLTYFIISNILTKLVNVFLDPKKRSSLECVLILCVYMFIGVGSVFILLRKQIRIA